LNGMVQMMSDAEREGRIDQAWQVVQEFVRDQEEYRSANVAASKIANARRMASESAWHILIDPGSPLPVGAKSEFRRSANAGLPVDGIFVLACRLTISLFFENAKAARQHFLCVVRPIGESRAKQPRYFETGLATIEETWAHLSETLLEAIDQHDPDCLLLEAAAALHRLGQGVAAPRDSNPPKIRISYNGPYLLTGDVCLTDHLGRSFKNNGPRALCRCGRSGSRPYCDGSHVEAEYTGAKDPRRVTDQRDAYLGQAATVLDNRGTCAHSGFCTDRLNSVFHLGQEPVVTPSGARLDEIIRAVRKCPSGALSFGIDGIEARDHVDTAREPSVEVSLNGPYRVKGFVQLVEDEGGLVARSEGSSLEHFSLCRCGASLNKPFCSGMHWSTEFADPLIDALSEPTLFEWAGGYPALLEMTSIFYSKYVPQDSLIGPLFAEMSPDHPERVACWLSEVFGGPKFYTEKYGGYARMISQHFGKHIKPEQRARWASLMIQSADDAGLPGDPEFRAAFAAYIEWGSRIAVENSGENAVPPPSMPVPRWWWVCDAKPGSRPSAINANHIEMPKWSPPADGEILNFDVHIKPLFRVMDRNSMRFAFDLWSENEVAKHGSAILERLNSGTMPCDGAWPNEKLAVFKKWLDAEASAKSGAAGPNKS
jgi:CDGSH-type Zn-finger protein/truncated hemoglobin YjbI